MIPRTIVAQPDDAALGPRTDPDILPLPGAPRRREREPAAPPPAPAEEFGPKDILNALRYHSVLFATLGALAALGLGAAAWVLVPAKYTTYAMVYVAQVTPQIVPNTADLAGGGQFATLIKTEANKIKSTGTMIGAMRDPKHGLAQLPMLRKEEDPAAFLEDKIVTEFADTNQLIKVSLIGDDPVQITKIVNAVVEYYMSAEEKEQQWKARRLEKLTEAQENVQRMLSEKLKHYGQDYGPLAGAEAVTTKQRLHQDEYVKLQNRISELQLLLPQARDALKAAQAELEQFETTPVPLPPDLAQRMEADPAIAAKTFRVKKLQKSIDDHVRQASNPYGPHYVSLVNMKKAEEAELEALRQQFRASIESASKEFQRPRYAGAVKQAQDEVRRLEGVEQTLTQQLKNYEDLDTEKVEKKSPEVIVNKDDIEYLRNQLGRLKSSYLALKTELEAPPRVSIWQKAEVPTKSDMKKQLAVTGFAGFAGLGLVGGCISLYELRRKRVYGSQDPLFRRLPLLGCVPEHDLPPVAAGRGDGLDVAGRAFFEAVDKVKTVLCRLMQRRRMQALLVTSAAPGEGKSALAWQLALSLARTDKRTLFIDGNLRNPGLHNHFDIASHPGLSEVLRGEKLMAEVVQRTALDNLWCIAAGVCDDQARQALDKDALRRLLERSRQDFDYVILDTCSIREAVDPLYLAQRADGTVLSVRAFLSSTTDVERARERLSLLGTPLLGAVLTDASGAGCEL
jgi:capsular exopolysaccharide synthesis family protein